MDWNTGVWFPLESGILVFATTSKMALGLTRSPTKLVPGTLSPQVKMPELEDDLSPSSADFKNALTYTSISSYVFVSCCLIKPRGSAVK
jgi:hypothetical protein